MNPLIIACIISILISGASVWKFQDYRYAAIELERVEAERELHKMRNKAMDTASENHENTKIQIQTKYSVVTKVIDNVIHKIEYRDRLCFDDDGLRAHDGAVRLTGNTSEPESRMPTTNIPK